MRDSGDQDGPEVTEDSSLGGPKSQSLGAHRVEKLGPGKGVVSPSESQLPGPIREAPCIALTQFLEQGCLPSPSLARAGLRAQTSPSALGPEPHAHGHLAQTSSFQCPGLLGCEICSLLSSSSTEPLQTPSQLLSLDTDVSDPEESP